MEFEHALSDTIARSIPINESSSTEESAHTISDDVTVVVLAGDQDSVGADKRK